MVVVGNVGEGQRERDVSLHWEILIGESSQWILAAQADPRSASEHSGGLTGDRRQNVVYTKTLRLGKYDRQANRVARHCGAVVNFR